MLGLPLAELGEGFGAAEVVAGNEPGATAALDGRGLPLPKVVREATGMLKVGVDRG